MATPAELPRVALFNDLDLQTRSKAKSVVKGLFAALTNLLTAPQPNPISSFTHVQPFLAAARKAETERAVGVESTGETERTGHPEKYRNVGA